ncbi:MAG TPA: hypothetical protein VLA30_10735 [Burkholderiales bacterium]|nr:hypothetical protein [Burkholderiales bacterium]
MSANANDVRRRTKEVVVAITVAGALAIAQVLQARDATESKSPHQEFAAYREAAWAHFRKRCKEDSRETIHRVVENVEAIFLIRMREKPTDRELGDQYWMGDPYGYSSYEANHPIATYLFDRTGKTITGKVLSPIKGYKYVEVQDPEYKPGTEVPRYLRYTLGTVVVLNSVTKEPESRVRPIPSRANVLRSRYGVTWEDVSTSEDRAHWVAGGKLTVLDLQTNEVVAERVGFVIDPQLGSSRQGRRPWLAVGFVPEAFCPKFENRFDRNKEFVAKVLRASGGLNGR